MKRQLQKFWRKVPHQISITGLLILVAACAFVFMVMAPWLRTEPREYPQLRVSKFHDEDLEAPHNHCLVVVVQYHEGQEGSEFYSDYAPYGTLNTSIENYGVSPIQYFDETFLGNPEIEPRVEVSPAAQARCKALLQYVKQQQIDVQKMPWGSQQKLLLPEDFPTFHQFFADYKVAHPSAKLTLVEPPTPVEPPSGECGCGSR
ncbi:hypothetical protein LOC68_24215 [Blastopirellula sp. JC732]|uniref:Uncharacterized protein n=1 Tax=Blastopirellula sediminis TaxID=2894196 RepID=A0A9X1SIE5_9BACT|nr:hypothetical protein [Blastopirellula sediminis]MCC9605187.1 hypothetical protein [Blastopirellula sediminis]MCC9631513.1 hypothetical protein [Blastopirellula sediminis]